MRRQANRYLQNVGDSKRIYEAHTDPKVMVRYEALRADTLGAMRRVYSELGIPTDDRELARVVKEHSWENASEQDKGEGKFYRRGPSGEWRGDLTQSRSR